MQFDLYFEFTYGNSWPTLEFATDVVESTLSMDEHRQSVLYRVTTDDCKIAFKNINKKESDTVIEAGQIVRDQTVKLIKILADDILLDANLIRSHISFRPQYSPGYLSYCQEHNIVPQEITREDTLFFNGEWVFEFEQPFWKWYARCRHLENIKHFGPRELELYIGTTSQDHKELLEQLKDQLKLHA